MVLHAFVVGENSRLLLIHVRQFFWNPCPCYFFFNKIMFMVQFQEMKMRGWIKRGLLWGAVSCEGSSHGYVYKHIYSACGNVARKYLCRRIVVTEKCLIKTRSIVPLMFHIVSLVVSTSSWISLNISSPCLSKVLHSLHIVFWYRILCYRCISKCFSLPASLKVHVQKWHGQFLGWISLQTLQSREIFCYKS